MLRNTINGLGTREPLEIYLKFKIVIFSTMLKSFSGFSVLVYISKTIQHTINPQVKLSPFLKCSEILTSLVGLNQLWFADYQNLFQTINDNDQWNGQSRCMFFIISFGSFGATTLKWAGADEKSAYMVQLWVLYFYNQVF
jgi:hypothetical protein